MKYRIELFLKGEWERSNSFPIPYDTLAEAKTAIEGQPSDWYRIKLFQVEPVVPVEPAEQGRHMPEYVISHVDRVFHTDRVAKLITAACRELKRMEAEGMRTDAIAFRGMSGCLFAAPLAARMKKPMIMVRKKCVGCGSSQSHTCQLVEGDQIGRASCRGRA